MKAANPNAVAAQNKRKIEKDKRRKNYHDSQVQGTNNSSIVSKRSVEKIYNPITEPNSQEWFKYFVPQGKRRSPAINRGYWVRMESIKQAVHRIKSRYAGKTRIVNLGCGFDPFPFKTLAESADQFEFFDFDYPELVARKLNMIKEAPEIMKVVGEEEAIQSAHKDLGVIMSTATYKLVGCDLKDTSLYERQLNSLLHSGVPTVFIAEVSLAYMKPEHANPVVEILSKLPNSHVLVLEQIMPSGESHFFAQKMLYHFSHLRSPLQCVQTYSTKEKQQARFLEYFPKVEILDLFESWNQLVSPEMKQLVSQVEDFDEWEEFIVFCQHYVVIHATNSDNVFFKPTPREKDFQSIDQLALTPMNTSLNLKFPACASTPEGTYVHGGMFQTRTDELILLGLDLAPVQTAKPCARMGHTMSSLENGHLLLVGGRTRPGVKLSDVWVYSEKERSWKLIGDIGEGMARHSAVSIGESQVLVFGNGKFRVLKYTNETLDSFDLAPKGVVPELASCAMVYDSEREVGYIVGGMLEEVGPTINGALFVFEITGNEISVKSVDESAHLARIGCLAKIKNNQLYVFGGAGHSLQDQSSTVIKYDLSRQEIFGMRMADVVWKTFPLFIGSQLAGNTILGGGAVCYSFGSCYNNGYLISGLD